MKDRFSMWFPAGLLLLLAVLTFWLDRVVQPPAPVEDGSHRHDPDYWVENFTATRMGPDGLPMHTLSAVRMTHFPDDDSTHLTLPRLVHHAKGQPPMRVASREGRVSSNGEEVWLNGDVQIKREASPSGNALDIHTTALHVIPDQEIARTDRAVTIRSGGTHVTGTGMEFNNQTRIIRLHSRVKGQHVQPKP
jgi:lipopolysaccharide export system protein LptC